MKKMYVKSEEEKARDDLSDRYYFDRVPGLPLQGPHESDEKYNKRFREYQNIVEKLSSSC